MAEIYCKFVPANVYTLTSLINKQIYFSRPSQLNDIFNGTLSFEIENGERGKLLQAIQNHFGDNLIDKDLVKNSLEYSHIRNTLTHVNITNEASYLTSRAKSSARMQSGFDSPKNLEFFA